MAEIKNTFQGSKMNQDLDDRLIPNGTYRSGTNIQVSSSESDDVGTLQTVLGNFQLSDFGVPTSVANLEIIGQAIDQSKDMIIVFATNAAASTVLEEDRTGSITLPSGTTSNGVAKTASKCFICCFSPTLNGIIVQGSFLKFSKLFPVKADILEDLLFFTDNFNQPRKINIKTALSDPTYYNNEDQISVAKYYPYQPASFINSSSGYKKLGLIDKQSKFLPPSFAAEGIVYTGSTNSLKEFLYLKNGLSESQINLFAHMQVSGTEDSDIGSTAASIVSGVNQRIKVTNLSVSGTTEAFVRRIDMDATSPIKNCQIKLEFEDGTDITDVATSLPDWSTGHSFGFSFPNPDHDQSFAYSGQSRYLEDKFVRFSYRFKFDDGEYSLMAPFTQAAFIPKQHGYFIGRDALVSGRKGIVDFMENTVTNVNLNIPLPSSNSETLVSGYKVDSVQIVSKASDDQNIKVVADLDIESFGGLVASGSLTATGGAVGSGFSPASQINNTTGGSGTGLTVRTKRTGDGTADDYGPLDNFLEIIEPGRGYKTGEIINVTRAFADSVPENQTAAKFVITGLRSNIEYNYNSQQPIKVLPEKEIVRVSDIVPIKALAQAIVGNRVVYGNFLQKHGNIEKLDYDIEISDKKILSNTDQQIKEHPNHTVKQGRTYQVGVVLRDRFGRLSNVILNDDLDDKSSTIYVPHTAAGSDPLEYFGRSLKVKWNREIPDTGPKDWPGLYKEKVNETGWYSYQIVVKQKEQDYYNVYTAGSLSGEIVFRGLGDHGNLSYVNGGGNSHIVLSGDNINKVPRELKEVGGNDQQFGSTTDLICVVGEPEIPTGPTSAPSTAIRPKVSQQILDPKRIEVEEIKNFRSLGDWTMYKGINLRHLDLNGAQYSADTFIYPGITGTIDPLFLGGNKNPYVAKISTPSRIGYKEAIQRPGVSVEPEFAENLHVFETSPFKSALEIFYETGTSGLISELNTSIRTAEPSGVLSGISPIIFSLQEGAAGGTSATNTFEVMKGVGATAKIANPLALITLVNVFDGTGTRVTSKFQIVQATGGSSGTSPTFVIKNTAPFIFKNGSFDGDCVFDFTIKATCPDSEGTQVSRTFTFNNFRITNKKPIIYKLLQQPNNFFNTLEHSNTGDNLINSAPVLNSTPWNQYDINSPLDINTTGTTAFSSTQNGIYIERERVNSSAGSYTGINLFLATLGFITNGFEAISSFSSSTEFSSDLQNRHIGLKVRNREALRYSIYFNNDSNKEKYYFTQNQRGDGPDSNSGTNNTGVNRTFEFNIINGADSGISFIRWSPPSFNKVRTSYLGSNGANDYKAAWLYAIKLDLFDANDGTNNGASAGSKTSDPFYLHFIIYR